MTAPPLLSGCVTLVWTPKHRPKGSPPISLNALGRLLACDRGTASYGHASSVGDFRLVSTWPRAGHVFLFMPLSSSICPYPPFWGKAPVGGWAMIPGVQASTTLMQSTDGEQADH